MQIRLVYLASTFHTPLIGQDLRSRKVLDLDFQKRQGQTTSSCIWPNTFPRACCRQMRMMGNLGGSYADSKLAQVRKARTKISSETCEVHWRPENKKKMKSDFAAGHCALPGVTYTCFGKTLASKCASLTHYMFATDAGFQVICLTSSEEIWLSKLTRSWCSEPNQGIYCLYLFVLCHLFVQGEKSCHRPRQVVTHSLHPAIVERWPQVILGCKGHVSCVEAMIFHLKDWFAFTWCLWSVWEVPLDTVSY